MKGKKIAILVAMMMIAVLAMTGCSEASRVNANISKEANNFNVVRRIVVINARSDKPVFELVGAFSISNSVDNELVVTCEIGPGQYKKHYIYLNDWTMYVVEDLSGSDVSPYHYEINFLPQMIPIFEFTSNE